MLQHSVMFHLRPLSHFLLADGTQVAMFLLAVILHHIVPVALMIADLTLEFDNPCVDSLVCGNRRLASEELLAEVAAVSLGKHMNHLLVLPQLSRCQEFLVTEVALEAGLGPPVKLARCRTSLCSVQRFLIGTHSKQM